jgi:hypothetical protein
MRPYVVEDPNESLRACVASILERPISRVPVINMLDERTKWLQQLNAWMMSEFGSKWIANFLVQDEDGNAVPNAIWTPPGWYIEIAETEDGELTVFQCCSGNVVMHSPFAVKVPVQAKARLWLYVVDPAMAWPSNEGTE